jgi:Ser/Thr protein kinase RdoA (MazF antagonist)
MLQVDGGPTMRSRFDGHGDLRRWERMLSLYAELQVRACGHVSELLSAGAPDRRPAELRGLFERLVAAERRLPASSETRTAEEHARLSGLAGRVGEIATALDGFGLPASIDHSDLHAGNVLAPGDGCVFFDWHEAAVTHPFFSMVVATRWLAHHHGVQAGSAQERRLHDAYLDAWAGHGPHASLRAALDLALRAGTLTRALGWMRVVEGLPASDQAEWAEYVPGWLRDLCSALDSGPANPAMPY